MANTTERIGVSYCSLIAAKTEWMFREQPIDDIGIDAHMERTDTDGKVQQLLALQIKSGESYFKENKGDYVVFRDIDDRQYNYWTTNTLPCIVVLYNPKDDIQCKVALTIKEAAEYSNIGINKLESLLRSPRCPFVLYVGKKKLVKRKEFEKFISDNVEI